MPIDIRVEGFQRLAQEGARWKAARATFFKALKREGQRFGLDAVARAKKNYLSGPRPDKLGVVSGRLRSSVTSAVFTRGSDVEVEVGTNVAYAPAHELGFKGTVQVPSFTRIVTKVFGQSVSAVVAQVRAHTRKVDIEERPFIKPAVEDAFPAFDNSIGLLLEEIAFGGFGNAVSFGQ